MSEPKFYAVVKKVERNYPALQGGYSIPQIVVSSYEKDVLLKDITQSIKSNLRRSDPSDCWFIWGAKKDLEREQISVQHQRFLLNQLEILEAAHYQAGKTAAAKFLTPHLAQAIINEHFYKVEEARQLFLEKIHESSSRMDNRDADVEKNRGLAAQEQARAMVIHAESANLLADAEIKKANAREANARAAKTEELNEMLKYIRLHKMDKLPPELDAFIVACQAGDPTAFSDFRMGDILRDFMHRKQEADTAKAEHGAKMSEQEVERLKKEIENLELNLAAKRKKFSG